MRTLRDINKLLIMVTALAAVLVIINGPARASDPQTASFINFTGRIVKITGDVKIRRAGEKDWLIAKKGMELGVEDQVMTGIESSADLVFVRNQERSRVRILEKADMSLMTLNLDKVTGDSEILLDLAIGHIIIKTDSLKGKSRFEVLTPTSMTAVRGTGFEVKVVEEKGGPAANGDATQ